MSLNGDPLHSLWLDLRAAAGAMSLWGQVAATELAPGQLSQRILAASERLITVIDQLEEATGWSERDTEASGAPAPVDEAANGQAHCALGLLLGSESGGLHCERPATAADIASLRARLGELLERPADELAVPVSGRLVCGRLVLDIDGHTVEVAGRRLHVPGKEFQVLLVLMANSGRVLRPADLARAAWKLPATPKQIGDAVAVLRKRLAEAGASDVLRRMKPQGYRLVPPPSLPR